MAGMLLVNVLLIFWAKIYFGAMDKDFQVHAISYINIISHRAMIHFTGFWDDIIQLLF